MKTYLPLFTGFYNTIWEMDDSYLIEEVDEYDVYQDVVENLNETDYIK